MWPFTITPTITSVESVQSLVNEERNYHINLLQENPLIALTVNSLFGTGTKCLSKCVVRLIESQIKGY